ncbi:hypothetical protein K458DRAFT_100277 [Lentithecium fluviatile CBS 122367]|uniref:DUF7896 domain-containing protein n=1 Tax=Lentithecium fluviatile CBS 122367 TaxID=1168545 RepID=A0A6G1JI41_9PLEO|nr:hypothetical protein K458DRAFT_100277 [Lentithecium fluviatile CBS 122367]
MNTDGLESLVGPYDCHGRHCEAASFCCFDLSKEYIDLMYPNENKEDLIDRASYSESSSDSDDTFPMDDEYDGDPWIDSGLDYVRLEICPLCDERPRGFRSARELRNYVRRVHSAFRKVYIVVDGSSESSTTLCLRLEDCRSCRNKKHYRAWHKAATQVRRAHFR